MHQPNHRTLRFTLFAGVAIAALLAGCQTTQTAEKAPVEERTPSIGATAPGAGTAGTTGSAVTGSATGTQGNPLRDPRNVLSKRSVYFDYDSYAVKDEYKPLIEAHAKYLQTTRTARMTIQGNADERGSHEYNVALAQKRSDSVKRMMVLFGVTEIQVETVSFGKEKPRNQGHDEVAWAENRRDDMIYAGE